MTLPTWATAGPPATADTRREQSSSLQRGAMKLTRRAIPIPGPAARYEIHLQAHQRATANITSQRPRHLDNPTLVLEAHHAGSSRMPAIQRRTTARTTQTTKPKTEPVTDSHIDHTPPAAQPVNPRRPRNNTPRSGRIQPIPARPRQPAPVPVQRFPPARILSHDSILPQAQFPRVQPA